MDSFLPLSGFQLPFQPRLSRLYNDTKKSTEFVKEPFQNEEDPEIKALHRKLRIQKDRLVSWGLEWSDPSQSAEIDESLSKAGLSEVVGSVMSTIKDILAEAEPLWVSSKHLAESPRPAGDRKPPLVRWDKTRFEDLVRDLTSSIDTLYDLSRTRSMGAVPRRPSKTPAKGSAAGEEFRPFESSRIQTPQSIRPDSLTHLRPRQARDGPTLREVVIMSKTAYSELTHGTIREPWAPLLLEYAAFDSIYTVTGISPPMSRFEKLSEGLQQDPQRSPGTWTGLPRLLGYFEDVENSRFGLVYRFPPSFNAVSFEHVNKNSYCSLPTLEDILTEQQNEPTLEAKFRLAHNLANTVFDMHTRGFTHGDLTPKNVTFTDTITGPTVRTGDVDVRRPLVSSFDIFGEEAGKSSSENLRHQDTHLTQYQSLPNGFDERVRELASLAKMLLSIGLWTPLEKLPQGQSSPEASELLFQKLSQRCGSLYTRVVQTCWSAVEHERKGESTSDVFLSTIQMKATRYLEACCILDGVSGLEDKINRELQQDEQESRRNKPIASQPSAEFSKDLRDVKSTFYTPPPQPPARTQVETTQGKDPIKADISDIENEDGHGRAVSKPESKVKLYPHIPLAPDAIEKWNTILMPQINLALRQFYRKHPESVEISLESVGPSPAMTKPTVLVVCTSVGKIRAILKKRVGDLFDGSTGFALKVCRGHVLRSRKDYPSAMRSMANRSHATGSTGVSASEAEVDAINPEFQHRPGNGASIGAWIGDRHLPPVSFGGLVVVDDKAYGMTVHHMLDDPDGDLSKEENTRSSAMPSYDWLDQSVTGSSADDDFSYELSDTESEAYSESDITSDWGDEEDEEDEFEPGDIPGVEPGCGVGYVVTQPALDDVEEGFYPSTETEDEDHLDTFSLGEVFASSGIRRREVNGLVHEVDWALFEFNSERVPDDNFIPLSPKFPSAPSKATTEGKQDLLLPTAVAPLLSLPGMEVQCIARTSGLQTGQILPALTSVKIYGRTSPSHTYQITSMPPSEGSQPDTQQTAPIGIPGDSGAWIVEHQSGQLCGHVLAWSQRKRVAYICPMDVLLMDMAEALDASEIRLPTGQVIFSGGLRKPASDAGDDVSDDEEACDHEKFQAAPPLVTTMLSKHNGSSNSLHSLGSNSSSSPPPDASSPIRVGSSSNLGVLSRTMKDLKFDRGIGVSG